MDIADDRPLGITIAEVLGFEEVASGRPEALSGEDRLGGTIRWVHITDPEGIGQSLEGGELVLSTCSTVRTSASAMGSFLDELEAARAAGVIVELVTAAGEPDDRAIAILRSQARGRDVPIVLLTHRIKFVRVTELAHQTLLARQVARLEWGREVHEIFTQLSLSGAEAQDIVDQTAQLLSSPVILEDVGHRILAGAGAGIHTITARWSDLVGHLGEDEGRTWVQIPVGLRERRWGRLLVPLAAGAGEEIRLEVTQVIDRAGQALALARMAERDEKDLLLQMQSGLIHEIIASNDIAEEAARARARSLGFAPGLRARFVPFVVRLDRDPTADPATEQLHERAVQASVIAAAADLDLPCLSANLASGSFGIVLAVSERADEDRVLDSVLSGAQPNTGAASEWTAGVGSSGRGLLEAVAQLESAAQVAEAASTLELRAMRFHRYADVRLRGLLSTLGDDPRLRGFAEAELAPLLEDPELLDLLGLYLRHDGNKSAIARAAFLSRPALYARLNRLEDRLGVSLDDAESRTALHVALLWWRLNRP